MPGLIDKWSNCIDEILKLAHLSLVLVLAADQDVLELLLTGTGRNEVTADDVLLEAFEVIDTTSDRGLAEHLGGLLEGGCRDEAVGAESGPGDTME